LLTLMYVSCCDGLDLPDISPKVFACCDREDAQPTQRYAPRDDMYVVTCSEHVLIL
jgi:hypothetical protein